MIRLAGTFLVALALIGAVSLAADDPAEQPEPPIRLKKKARPQTEPEKPERLKEDQPAPTAPGEDAKETLARVSQNMEKSEQRLAKQDAGDGTQQIQRDILKDLDSLIDQKRQQQQQQQQQGGGGGGGSTSSARGGSSRSKSGSQPGSGKGADSQARNGTGAQPKTGNSGSQAGMGNGNSPREMNRIADLYKDVWGHYPELMRMELDAYSREKFMPRYRELLEQYYATIAEKGRRQGD
jgi:hypothetical protein